MKKTGEIIAGIILSMAVLIFMAFLALFQLGDQEAFFKDQIQENQLEQVVSLEEVDIVRAYEQILDFSEGKRENLAGPSDPFTYSEKEIQHMEDVRTLFLLLRRLGWVSLGVIALIFIFSLTKDVSGVRIWVSSWVTLAGVGILAVISMDRFQVAFIRFHELLFSNDLWLLNPQTDFLIQIMPEAFFVGAAKLLFIRIGIGYGLLHLLLGAIYKYRKSVLAE